ncbi:MAG TPA: hypothetical protein VFH39_02650, partial [Candidatus Saccharimonadales bacterium]|nr:hypothetical protein [Candidatus Saccharimonadales bacterium]
TDYIFRRLALDYLSFDDRLELGLANLEDLIADQTTLLVETPKATEPVAPAPVAAQPSVSQPAEEPVSPPVDEAPGMPSEEAKALVGDSTAPLCYNCGNQTQRSGSCYVCTSCGSTTGCS